MGFGRVSFLIRLHSGGTPGRNHTASLRIEAFVASYLPHYSHRQGAESIEFIAEHREVMVKDMAKYYTGLLRGGKKALDDMIHIVRRYLIQ